MNLLTRRSSTTNSQNPSPTLSSPSTFPHNSFLPVPPTASSSSNASSSSLHRSASSRSQRSGLIPSPRLTTNMLPPAPPDFHPSPNLYPNPSPGGSGSGTASGSRSGSLISTPKILSRRGSTKEKERSGFLGRKGSVKGKEKAKEQEERVVHPSSSGESQTKTMTDNGSAEVIETAFATTARHPETGRKMINQYLVLEEIGHGTHGVVRLGRDLSAEMPSAESGDFGPGLPSSSGAPLYAIKIVERVPKRKKLQTLRKTALGKTDGGKMMGESEIRKELAMFKKVNHPNIVKMREIIDDPEQSRIFMILEYCKGGEIKWREDDGWPAFTVARTREIFRDTLLGLEYLHHQGIIHRDIKPSNLLVAEGNRVKISDFGCSHYSEALRVSSAQPGPEGDAYVDDVELAKTAGSPAFFAPEMCYTGFDDEEEPRRDSLSPLHTPVHELPGFTLRPPSMVGETGERKLPDPLVLSPSGRALQLGPTRSRESSSRGSILARPMSQRTHSSATLPRKQRLPITNAIDVWALGVTLYCLLFGKTPFDAPNEYLLMQVIPTQDYEIPPTMGKEQLPIADPAAQDALDLLARLMEKVPGKRITLEQAKRHPFTLRGVADPTAWLLSTDPHAQTFVTVSNEEVMSVVKSSTSFREGFRKGMKALGRRLHITGGGNRSRSRSIGEAAESASSLTSSTDLTTTTSNLPATPRTLRARHSSTTREIGLVSPNPGSSHSMSRRLSMLGSKFIDPIASPRRQTVQIGSSTPHSRALSPGSPSPAAGETMDRTGSSQSNDKSLRGPRPSGLNPNLSAPTSYSPAMVPLADDTPRSPRQMTSMGSLDKVKSAPDLSPKGSLQRRQSSDIDSTGRQRSPSNASSTGMSVLGNKLARLLSRNNSSRSRKHHHTTSSINGHGPLSEHAISTSDTDHEAIASASAGTSPHDRRISLEEGLPRRSHETFESSSYSSRGGVGPSPEKHGMPSMGHWESRLRTGGGGSLGGLSGGFVRRGSNLSEEFSRAVYEGDEEVDWNGPISDDDDDDVYDETPAPGLTPAAPNFKNAWAKELSVRGRDGASPSTLTENGPGTGLGIDMSGPLSPTSVPPNLPAGGILDLTEAPLSDSITTIHPQPVHSGHPDSIAIHPHASAPPALDSIPDASPPATETVPGHSPTVSLSIHRPSTPGSGYPYHTATAPTPTSPSHSIHSTISEFGVGAGVPRSSSANSHRYGTSPYRKHGPERARSPLGREHREYDGMPPSPQAATHVGSLGSNHSPMRSPGASGSRPMGLGRSYSGEVLPWRATTGGSGSPGAGGRSGSPSHPVLRGGFAQTTENDEEDEDEGLAISTASRRGRKGSLAMSGRRGTLSQANTPPGTNGRGTPIGTSPARERGREEAGPAETAQAVPAPQAA